MFYSFNPSLLHSFTPSLLHSFTPSFFHSFTLSLVHSITLSLVHSVTLSLGLSLLHSFTPSLLQSFTASLLQFSLLHLFTRFRLSLPRLFAYSAYPFTFSPLIPSPFSLDFFSRSSLFLALEYLPDDLRVTEAVEEVILDLEELPYPAADVAGESVAGRVLNTGVDHSNGARKVERVVRRLAAHDHAVPSRGEPAPAQTSKTKNRNPK